MAKTLDKYVLIVVSLLHQTNIIKTKTKIMKANFKKHLALVQKLAKKVNNRATYGMDMYAIDITTCGICEPFLDPENETLYRFTIKELAKDTFESEEVDHRHYRDAAYRSIFDY